MQNSDFDIAEIIEGTTKFLVPRESITEKVPPKEPAFFNPRAKLNRDFSIIAYSAFLKNFDGPKIFLEGLSGLGARGLRVSNEIKSVEKVVINDLNPSALDIAKRSAKLNELKNVDFSENEICRFLSDYSKKGNRGTIVDIDPFGSPSRYIDCGIRATMHGGMLSVTATDLQVLHGLFQNACKRRYGGTPIKVEYGNEIAIRLILGCIRSVAARLDIEFIPLFVESDMHYYRVYLKILNRPDQEENLGYIIHCKKCGKRETSLEKKINCESCGEKNHHAGPLWIGKMFDKKFLELMLDETTNFQVDKTCERIIQKCILEEDMPGTYYTLDEIASRLKTSPIRLEKIIEKLQESGFKASQTCLNPTGFRTDADIEKIKEFF
ncbi:MAG: tRNA (guanine-N1)-methyltransferase [Crenarchaeota archaeon]|nr:MAG: tRNA (guanine-N1)-methyltransferase [Thermoproteota archaeon]RDJ33019.1 MAG: tRNA (guanine-N1)-methyltransferase [Thermoproteota archaeon]RDJ35780.1 MAG: tRNA (guanine-N1)-methyltransferase [Thermoproteota archaeon]RDJ36477.1 MAG: tRNA (guanine-N1)-methyltransferase [Thermoproteota archaeon]